MAAAMGPREKMGLDPAVEVDLATPDLALAMEVPGPASRSPKFHQTTLPSGKYASNK